MHDSREHADHRGIDVRGALAVLRRRAWVILICFLCGAGPLLGLSLLQENQYSAVASLLFRDPEFDQRLFGAPSGAAQDPAREGETNVRLVSLDVVADLTAEDLDEGLTGDEVSLKVAVQTEGQSDVVSITATDPDPVAAANLANAFADNYVDFRRDADQAKVADARALVEAELTQLSTEDEAGEEGQALEKQVSQLKTLEALQTGNAEVVQEADPPTTPSSPDVVRNTVLGGVLGLLVGTGLAFLLERLDRRLRDPEELEAAFGLPLLGTIPESKSLREGDDAVPTSLPFGEREAFRMVRTRLRYFNVDREIRVVLITSASPNEGKSTLAWNLAATTASGGSNALLVEADFHHPTVAANHNLAPIPGLAEFLTHQSSLEGTVQRALIEDRSSGRGDRRHVDVIPAGTTPPNPTELLESHEMESLLEQLRGEYDLVVIDTPPLRVLADAIPLTKLVSGVIVVGRVGKTTRDEAVGLREELSALGAPMLGVVANRASARGRAYGYGYYYSDPEAGQRDRSEPSGTDASARPAASSGHSQPRAYPGSDSEQSRATSATHGSSLVDLNAATHAQLGDLGLSDHQRVELLAYRRKMGGFVSVDELERLERLDGELLADLKRKLTV